MPSDSMCSSTQRLLSKCGTPDSGSAPPTELYMRCGTPARTAASAIPMSVAVSRSVPSVNGVVIANTASTPYLQVFQVGARHFQLRKPQLANCMKQLANYCETWRSKLENGQ